MSAAVPQPGDIVIRESSRDGAIVFVLHTVPGPDQMIVPTRNEAVQRARLFAARQSVRVWLANGETELKLLDA
jgi:hypothetical protein